MFSGHSLGSQGAQCQTLDVAVSALAWLSPKVLVSGAEDGSLQGWHLTESSLQSLWLLSRYQKPVLGLATSNELLASASGTAGWAVSSFLLKMLIVSLNLYVYAYKKIHTHTFFFFFTTLKVVLNAFILHKQSRLFLLIS